VTLLLLFKPFLELFDELFETTQRLYFGLFLVREILHKLTAQPIVGNKRFNNIVERLQLLKMSTKCLVETIKVLLVLYHAGAAKEVELVHVGESHVALQAFHKVEQFPRSYGNTSIAQTLEKINQHGLSGLPTMHEGQSL